MNRVIAYIDGHNLYNGMLDIKWPRKYLWLNVYGLIKSIIAINQEIVVVRYFSSLRDNEKPNTLRKKAYLEALDALPNCEVIRGKYILEDNYCPRCKRGFKEYKEKMTDVNMVIQLLKDADNNMFDVAFLLTGDSDLVPAVREVKAANNNKRIVSIFPPMRTSDDLKEVVDAHFRIGRANIAQNPLPNKVKIGGGMYIERPSEWS